jgi:AraC-like DNA-binding protein
VKPKRPSFFGYFPVSTDARRWEINATSFGCVAVPAGSAVYPPDAHPAAWHFAWETGRELRDFQILCIEEGGGEFESSATGRVTLERGSVVLLFPGVWHRYRPRVRTGWTELWLELHGLAIDRLRKNGTLDPRQAHFPRALDAGLSALWNRAWQVAGAKPPGFTVRLGLIGLEILHALTTPGSAPPAAGDDALARAQTLLAAETAELPAMDQLAREVGMGYSHFRRAFKKHTGFSPHQYACEIRHRRCRELLAGTTQSIKEIADRLGYSSPYHLTKDFRTRAGVAPSVWRQAGSHATRS